MRSNFINTLIFAIRHWQATGSTALYPILEDGNPNILTDGELDQICEDLNLGYLHVLDADIDASEILKGCLPLVQGIVEAQPDDWEDTAPKALLQRMEHLFREVGWSTELVPAEQWVRDWIVTGRCHGDDEATSSHVTTAGDECPQMKFARTVLFGDTKDEDLPEKFADPDADGDERGWYIDATFEIAGPPLSQST